MEEAKRRTKLGRGVFGEVFRSQYGKHKCVAKVENYLFDMTAGDPLILQLRFDQEVAQLHNDHFLRMLGYSTSFIEKQKSGASKKTLEYHPELKERTVSGNKCIIYYAPVLKYTFESVKYKVSASVHLTMLKQVAAGLRLMHKAGYCHHDLHDGNIMARNSKQWYIIDYGRVQKHGKKYIRHTSGDDWGCLVYYTAQNKPFDESGWMPPIEQVQELKIKKYLPSNPHEIEWYAAAIIAVPEQYFGLMDLPVQVTPNRDYLLTLLKKRGKVPE
jgi:hypothetical protein